MSELCVSDSPKQKKRPKKTFKIPKGGFLNSLAAMTAEHLHKKQERAEKREAKKAEKEAQNKPVEKPPFRVVLRGKKQPASEGRVFPGHDAFWDALACKDFQEENPVIEWDGTEEYCILDIDFHHGEPPDNLRAVCDTVKPAPIAWWYSRTGGSHLLYSSMGRFSAADVAAIARMNLRDLLPSAEFELLNHTRHPGYPCEGREKGTTVPAREIVRGQTNPADLERVWRSLLSEFDAEAPLDEDARDSWLEDRDLKIGGYHPHIKCPFDPSNRGQNDPVRCFPEYVYCHVCKRGASYSRLTKGDLPVTRNHLRNAVKHFAHWEHVRHFVKDKEGYRALLTAYHLQDGNPKKEKARRELIDRVFDPDLMIVRCERVWLQTDFRPVAEKGLADLISSLPALQYIDDSGEIRLSKKRRALFLGTFDLTRFGYPEVIPLHGVDVAQFARVDEPQKYFDPPIYAVIPATPPFTYIREAENHLSWAKQHLEEHFPGVRFNLIEWLIFIKGCFQLGYIDEVIVTFITGQSEGGKTAHGKLAGLLSFEEPELIRLRKDEERFRQDFADASRVGTLAIINEAGKAGMTGSDVHQTVLLLERGMRYHHMYFGPRKVRRPAAPVMTNPKMPDEVRADKQTRRRCIEFPLGAGIQVPGKERDWYKSCLTGNLQNWLLRDDSGNNLRCANVIVSYVMDKYFGGAGANPRPADVARALGINTVDQAANQTHTTLRELFELWTTAERFEGKNNIWRGGGAAGWVVFNPSNESPLAKVYAEATGDGQHIERVEAENWGLITEHEGLVCEIIPRNGRPQVGIRFGYRTAEGGFTPFTLETTEV